MGWCSGTEIFDRVVEILLEPHLDKKKIIKELLDVLEDQDWDCQQDSLYWDHPLVRKVFEEVHPKWFTEEGE